MRKHRWFTVQLGPPRLHAALPRYPWKAPCNQYDAGYSRLLTTPPPPHMLYKGNESWEILHNRVAGHCKGFSPCNRVAYTRKCSAWLHSSLGFTATPWPGSSPQAHLKTLGLCSDSLRPRPLRAGHWSCTTLPWVLYRQRRVLWPLQRCGGTSTTVAGPRGWPVIDFAADSYMQQPAGEPFVPTVARWNPRFERLMWECSNSEVQEFWVACCWPGFLNKEVRLLFWPNCGGDGGITHCGACQGTAELCFSSVEKVSRYDSSRSLTTWILTWKPNREWQAFSEIILTCKPNRKWQAFSELILTCKPNREQQKHFLRYCCVFRLCFTKEILCKPEHFLRYCCFSFFVLQRKYLANQSIFEVVFPSLFCKGII